MANVSTNINLITKNSCIAMQIIERNTHLTNFTVIPFFLFPSFEQLNFSQFKILLVVKKSGRPKPKRYDNKQDEKKW